MRRQLISCLLAGAGLAATGMIGCSDETASVLRPLPIRSFNFILTREGQNVPRGTVVATRSSTAITSLSVEMQGLEVLRDPYFYQVWLGSLNPTTNTISNYRPLTAARFIRVTTDTTISPEGDFVPNTVTDTVLNVPGSFNAGGPGTLVRLEADAAALATVPRTTSSTAATVLLVTIDSVQGAPTPPDSVGSQGRLWARSINFGTTSTRTTALSFGNFHADPAQEYVFRAAGRGRGSLLENENILIVNDSSLARPPRGYFYATTLVTREDGETFFNLDTIPLGPQTAPFPDRDVSLFDADIEQVHPVVQVAMPNPQIFAAQTRVDGDEVDGLGGSGNPFRGVALIWVTLESKFGTEAASPVIILAGAAPPGIRTRD